MNSAQRVLTDSKAVWRTADRRSAIKWSFGLLSHLPSITTRRSLVPADLELRADDRCHFSVNGVTVELPGTLFSAAREMYCRRVYWPSATYLPTSGWRVADFGSNVGLFSLYAAKADAWVVSVEAQSRLADQSEVLLTANGVRDRVRLIHGLLGGGHTGALAGPTRGPDWEREPMAIGVEEVFDAAGFEQVELVKMDIEGAEYDLVSEAPQWLPRVERITMEIHAAHGEPERFARLLESHHFSVDRATSDLEPVASLTRSGYLYATRLGHSRKP